MNSKILVTGGLGFIGSHLVEALIDLKYEVAVIDNLSSASDWQLPPEVKFFRQDISEPSVVDLVAKIKPAVIFHFAADKRVIGSPAQFLTNNVIGTFNLLEAAKAAQIKQFIFTSSAAVYGDPAKLPIKETDPTRPISGYGLSKLVGELYCQQYQAEFITSVFRLANVYGPRQSHDAEGGVVAIFIDKLLHQAKPIIYGNGRQTRDFVFVKDVVAALLLAVKQPDNFILNIGSHQPTAVLDLINQISQLLKIKPMFISQPVRPMEIKDSLFDYSQAKKVLGWQPQTKLSDGLYETINYFTGL